MRLAIIAAKSASPKPDPVLGERDALLVRSRLELDDLGFHVTVVNPSVDLAEQLDEAIAAHEGYIDDLVVYASCLLAVVEEGECFLCLNPEEPDVGDALRDVARVITGRARRALLIADLRYDDPDADNQALGGVIAAVKSCVDGPTTGVELIAAVRSVGAHVERIPSRLTAGLLEAIDDRGGRVSARQAYAAAIQRGEMGRWPNAVCYEPGARELWFNAAEEDLTPTVPRIAPETDLTPTVPLGDPEPREADSAPAATLPSAIAAPTVAIGTTDAEPPPPPASERRQAATSSLPQRRKPQDVGLPKVVLGSRASKSSPPPAEEPASTRQRPTMETFADGPAAKRVTRPEEPASAPPPDSDPAPASVPPASVPPASVPPEGDNEPRDLFTTQRSAEELDAIEDVSIEEEIAPRFPPPSRKRPIEMTVEDHVKAADLARTAGKYDDAIAQYKKALAKLGTSIVPMRADVYMRMGEIMRKKGNTRIAISNFDKALSISPSDSGALAALIELNADANNWRAVHAAEEKFLAGVDSDTRLDHLLKSGDMWRERAADIKRAKERYTAARTLAPKRVEPLERLLLIYETEGSGALEFALDARRRIADLTTDRRRRAIIYYELGGYCSSIGREDEAHAAYELALDSDPTMLEPLEALATVLAEGQEWGELERVYKKMIGRFSDREQDDATADVLVELHRRLALLYRDHLEDPESALGAVEGELALRPHQLAARLMAAELAEMIDDYESTLEHLRLAASIEPQRAETYHQIFRVAQRHDDVQAGFLSASVAVVLGAADDRERVVHRERRAEGVPALHRPIDDGGWELLRNDDHDTSVDEVMRAVAPSVLRARVKQLAADKKLPDLKEEQRQDIENSTISAVRSLGWACQFLAVAPPTVYIDETSPTAITAPFAKRQTSVIGKEALSGRSLAELAFLAGRHVTLRLPEHELVAHLRSYEELSTCFLAALKLAVGDAPMSGSTRTAVEKLSQSVAAQQLPEEREALRAAVERFREGGGRVNLHTWVESVERCANRAGLLLCGDLDTAARIIRSEGNGVHLSESAQIEDLCAFNVSAAHAKLRTALGIAPRK